ncbi:hypothetical protein THTE_0948 [Thermogutta terrifontis]|uniref:Uncharacterized protein n=1 Tax=Thermogutta terrifontis TaxID=1331910 RepID=A0A286RC61_9BACT|nr:hypothetical protein THTE_0948 [Thermogutta terrifontis]
MPEDGVYKRAVATFFIVNLWEVSRKGVDPCDTVSTGATPNGAVWLARRTFVLGFDAFLEDFHVPARFPSAMRQVGMAFAIAQRPFPEMGDSTPTGRAGCRELGRGRGPVLSGGRWRH